ncbi:MAG: two-component system response regulator FixJ [Alphaproteobacteria bacterium]
MVRAMDEAVSVYVVDDDDAVRDSLRALLEPEGFFVKPYASVNAFLDDMDENTPGTGGPACLLLDLNMPGRGGLDLLAVLAERDSDLPVVVMTGTLDEGTRTRALYRGAVAFLEKPVDADQLIDTLRHACAPVNRTVGIVHEE